MNAQKIINVFETRKRVTKQAIEDMYDIFNWITDQVDSITIKSEIITCRLRDYEYEKRGGGNLDFFIGIINGNCGLWLDSAYENEYIQIWKDEIDYINIAEVINSLNKLFEKLENYPTRENSSNSISKIKQLLK